MYKKIGIILVVCSVAWCFVAPMPPVNKGIYNVQDGSFRKIDLHLPGSSANLPVVQQINQNCSSIISVVSSQLEIKTKHRLARLSGTMYYQKPKNFHMVINSQFGTELDIGSNNTVFWFSSKNYQDGTLFFCKHDEINKSRLKTPLNPTWMMASLGFNEIDTNGAQFVRYGDKLAVVKQRIGNGIKVKIVNLIDPSIPMIIGNYLYDDQDHLLASCEVIKEQNKIPLKWLIRWSRESMIMELGMISPTINASISPKQWEMPITNKSVNMATN